MCTGRGIQAGRVPEGHRVRGRAARAAADRLRPRALSLHHCRQGAGLGVPWVHDRTGVPGLCCGLPPGEDHQGLPIRVLCSHCRGGCCLRAVSCGQPGGELEVELRSPAIAVSPELLLLGRCPVGQDLPGVAHLWEHAAEEGPVHRQGLPEDVGRRDGSARCRPGALVCRGGALAANHRRGAGLRRGERGGRVHILPGEPDLDHCPGGLRGGPRRPGLLLQLPQPARGLGVLGDQVPGGGGVHAGAHPGPGQPGGRPGCGHECPRAPQGCWNKPELYCVFVLNFPSKNVDSLRS
mmetsp:Transcript_113854/g.261382  ORF Transcript_113854/g.261382 Transcript_113854/m.261382 type:complete len:294 (-) Transcript_113854:169-1050(-)